MKQVGEKVDARDLKMGTWFEARVLKIVSPVAQQNGDSLSSSSSHPPDHLYRVAYDGSVTLTDMKDYCNTV